METQVGTKPVEYLDWVCAHDDLLRSSCWVFSVKGSVLLTISKQCLYGNGRVPAE